MARELEQHANEFVWFCFESILGSDKLLELGVYIAIVAAALSLINTGKWGFRAIAYLLIAVECSLWIVDSLDVR